MNRTKLMMVALIVATLLMIPLTYLSFYTDYANEQPDPSKAALSHDGATYTPAQGKKTFEKYQCMDCHTVVGNGAYFAPDVTTAYERAGGSEGALAGYILSGALSKGMPSMAERGMTEAEAYRVVSFLKYTNQLDRNGWPPEGSWEQSGSFDPRPADSLTLSSFIQPGVGIVFINLLLFAVVLIYELRKERGAER